MLVRYSYQNIMRSIKQYSTKAQTRIHSLAIEDGVRLDQRKLQILQITPASRPIFYYPDFFSTSEIERIQENISDMELEHARTAVADFVGAPVEKKIVPVLQSHFTAEISIDAKTQASLTSRFFSLNSIPQKVTINKGNFNGDFDITGFADILKFLSYLPPAARNNYGIEKMVMHRDYPELQSQHPYIVSMYSFLACITKAAKGGGLDLYSDDSPRTKLTINLNPGAMMFFASNPSSLLHNPIPVTEGHRLIMRGSILGKRN